MSGLSADLILAQDQRIHEMAQRTARIEARLDGLDNHLREAVVSLRAVHARMNALPCVDHDARITAAESAVQTVKGAAVTIGKKLLLPLAIGLLGGAAGGQAPALVAALTALLGRAQ